MKMTIALAGGTALTLLFGVASASTADAGSRTGYHRLPPVAGTIRLPPERFGTGRFSEVRPIGRSPRSRTGYRLHSYTLAELAARPHRFPAAYLLRNGYGQGSVYWNRRVPFYGEGNDTLALVVSGWGQADSATTGGPYPPPSPRYHSTEPVRFRYGTPFNDRLPPGPLSYRGSVGSPSAGAGYAAATGGLDYYSYGSPGTMAYYSSGSSAGPGGTPGGLATYRTGSYGAGPRVLTFGRGSAQWNGGAPGPRIIHVHDSDDLSPG